MVLYHATTPKKASLYKGSKQINKPVRGFTSLQAAMAWAIKINGSRTVFYEIDTDKISTGISTYKLPDHHNVFGEAWWIDSDVPYEKIKCVFSAESDA